MWFRVQGQEVLIEAKFIFINKAKAKVKKAKVTINCSITSNNPLINATFLGMYESVEEAQRIFEDIQANIVQGNKLYIMP